MHLPTTPSSYSSGATLSLPPQTLFCLLVVPGMHVQCMYNRHICHSMLNPLCHGSSMLAGHVLGGGAEGVRRGRERGMGGLNVMIGELRRVYLGNTSALHAIMQLPLNWTPLLMLRLPRVHFFYCCFV